jgi:hypothetical protein
LHETPDSTFDRTETLDVNHAPPSASL